MNVDITFANKTMKTPMYIKMDAHEQLLLSKGVCRQLGIITYHQDVVPLRKSSQKKPLEQPKRMEPVVETEAEETEGIMPPVRVSLVRTISLFPYQNNWWE